MRTLKRTILKYIPFYKFLSFRSYAQEGEDMMIRSFFEHRKGYKGYYVDVGAHHPFYFSNTKYFYNRGWRGINIEPCPDVFPLFRLFRRKDINLNMGISNTAQDMTYYCFNEPALNSFSKELAENRDAASTPYFLKKTIRVETSSLAQVLDTYLPKGQHIDFLSIDAEGFDFIVLQSNDWKRYRPTFVLVEEELGFDQIQSSEVFKFMVAAEYELVAKSRRTLFFQSLV